MVARIAPVCRHRGTRCVTERTAVKVQWLSTEQLVNAPQEAVCNNCGTASKVVAVSWSEPNAATITCLIKCPNCGPREVLVKIPPDNSNHTPT